jgi:hypothetical protein
MRDMLQAVSDTGGLLHEVFGTEPDLTAWLPCPAAR